MAQETLTLRTMNNGGIIEAVDAALAKIAENIADINTPPPSPAGGINPAIYPAPPLVGRVPAGRKTASSG